MKNKSKQKSFELLQGYFAKKQKANPRYSMRAFARDLDVSPSFISGVLSGAKALPLARVSSIAAKLGLDEVSTTLLRRAVLVEQLPEPVIAEQNKGLDFLSQFKEEDLKNLHLFRHWYHIAILDLATCSNFKADVMWIGKKLGIKTQKASEAISFLTSAGYLMEEKGRLIKSDNLLRTPTLKSHEAIRNFHKQLMIKAIDVMNSDSSPEAFEKRWISGITMAANPEKIAEAKKRLNLSLHEIAAFLSEGECTEVYQMGVQFYPLTKKV